MNKQQQTSIFIMALLLSLLLIVTTQSLDVISVYASPVTIFSTRDHFDKSNGQENSGHMLPTVADLFAELDRRCQGEIAIYVHGVWADQQSALEQVQRVDISLRQQGNNYDVTVVGFSWDSDTNPNLNGWQVAKVIANQNGKLLADLIVDYKGECPNDKVRLIAHSLGSRVILSALQSLHDESRGKIIRSVHLMGAAVDDEQVSTDDSLCLSNLPPRLLCSGRAIESTVQTKLYNLHNYEDNFLHRGLGYTEDFALGLDGSVGSEPNNYEEYSVLSSIPPIPNADGNLITDCRDSTIDEFFWSSSWGFNDGWGDNHCGYMGFRTLPSLNPWKDGAIENVVIDWRNNP
jgi:hypothetical protein